MIMAAVTRRDVLQTAIVEASRLDFGELQAT